MLACQAVTDHDDDLSKAYALRRAALEERLRLERAIADVRTARQEVWHSVIKLLATLAKTEGKRT